jgi:hypothetical protein
VGGTVILGGPQTVSVATLLVTLPKPLATTTE